MGRVGRDLRTGRDIALDLRAPSHLAVQGRTRSGKSAFTYGVLGGLAADIAAGTVHLAGVDPTGLLLGQFERNNYRGRYVCGGHKPARYVELLRLVIENMDKRISWLNRRNLDTWPIFDRAHPLLLVVVEELPAILPLLEADDAATGRKTADRLAKQWTALLGRLLAESAKAGIRLLLIAQRFAVGEGLRGTDRGNIGTRLTLAVNDRASVEFLHEGIDSAFSARVSRFNPGQGLFEVPGGNRREILTDFVTFDDFKARVARYRKAPLNSVRGG